MSENTSDTPQIAPGVPPRPCPGTGQSAQPPYQTFHHGYQQPPKPASSFGCGKVAVFSLIVLFALGVIGVCTLVGTFFLLSVAAGAFDEILVENKEKTVTEKFISGNRQADYKVVILTIEGLITSNADGFVAKQIRRVLSDGSVKAVVLRVESPGGTMSGSDYYLYQLKQMKAKRDIPVVVSMGSMATSGGYYVAMVGDEIYAEPTTITGSIGVIASLFDASDLFEKIGVEPNLITSGRHKAMGSITKPLSEEERAIWQHLIDENFARFKQIIREGRKDFADAPEELDKLATGQIFTANEAVANKLIDTIGFLEDAIKQAGELAKLDEDDYRVIQYTPKLSALDVLLEARSPNKLLNTKTLSEITIPKLYLVCPYVLPVDEMK